MSMYFVHKLCKDARRVEALRELLLHDPSAALAGYRLTDRERTALLAGDVVGLLNMGAHGYLLSTLARLRLFGLTPELYVQRKDAAQDQ